MNPKIFIGRENELEQFIRTMDALVQSPDRRETYANTILVYGVGGMGKTYLCRRFLEIAKTKYPQVVRMNVDWGTKAGCTFTPVELLDILCGELKHEFTKEIHPYLNAKKDIKKTQEEINRLLERDKELMDSAKPIVSSVATAVSGQPPIGALVSEGFGFLGKFLGAKDEDRLKKKWGINDEELLLYKNPESVLANHLRECINTITTKKKKQILMILDTCELIRRSEEWLMDHFLVPLLDNSRSVILVYSGRDNIYNLRTVTIREQSKKVYGFADRLTIRPPIPIDMKLFSEIDIRNYLKEKLEQDVPEEAVRFVQTFARGVPYAVDLLTNAMHNLGIKSMMQHFQDAEFQDQLERIVSNEQVIKIVTDRFLFYCFQTDQNKADLPKIYTLAILQDTNPELLREIWQVHNPADILQMLEGKYAFFVGDEKLHEVVQEFLGEYLLENQSLREDIAKEIAEKALPIYQRIYQKECAEEPIWQERFDEPRWREAVLKLVNCLAWSDPSQAIDFFIKRGIELLLLNVSFVRTLKKPLDKVLEQELVRRKLHRQVNAFMKAVEEFRWGSLSEQVLSFCQEAIDEWELEPVHRSILILFKGRMLYFQNDYEATLNTLFQCDETVLEKSLKDKLAEALDTVGQKLCLDEKNNFFFSEKALKAFEKVVQLNDRKDSYFYHLAVMLRQSGQAEKALPYYSKSLALDPKDKYVWKSQGMAFRDLGRYEDAIAAYEKAIELDPKYVYAYADLGDVYCDLGRYEDAIAPYRKAIETDPKCVYVYSELAVLHTDLGEFDKAEKLCAKAAEIDPKNSLLLNTMGTVQAYQGKFAKAIEYFEGLIEMKLPTLGFVYNNIGEVHFLMGQYDKAIEWYKKAIEHRSEKGHNGLGYAYLVLSELNKAESLLLQGIQIQPNSNEPKKNLALTYLHQGKLGQAQQYFTEVVEFCNRTQRIGSQLNKVIALSGLQRFDEALQLLKQLAEKFTIGPVMAKGLLSDLELLASAPQAPEGMQQFLQKAREILVVK